MKVDIDRLFTLAALDDQYSQPRKPKKGRSMSHDKQRERDAISGPCVSADARAECDAIADKLSAAAASETGQSSVQPASTAWLMESDDVLAWLASRPRQERPTVAKTDAAMLRAWIALRNDTGFRNDVVCRHGLNRCGEIHPEDHNHAIGNAWSHVVQALRK